MKKLILLALLLGGLPTFAQKTFEVYNYTAYTVQLADIATKVATGTYPEFHSKPSGLISIPPGGSYTLSIRQICTAFHFFHLRVHRQFPPGKGSILRLLQPLTCQAQLHGHWAQARYSRNCSFLWAALTRTSVSRARVYRCNRAAGKQIM